MVDMHENGRQDIFHSRETLLCRHHACLFFVYDVMSFGSFRQRHMYHFRKISLFLALAFRHLTRFAGNNKHNVR
jgi:hypothetical protein